MNTEFIGEKAFFDEVHETEHAWLAMHENNIYMNKDSDETIILFIWSNKTKAQDYLDHVNSENLKPIQWPIKNIINLFEQIPQIEAIGVNPTGQSNQILTYNVKEFREHLEKNKNQITTRTENTGVFPEKQNLNCGWSRKFASPPVIITRYVFKLKGFL